MASSSLPNSHAVRQQPLLAKLATFFSKALKNPRFSTLENSTLASPFAIADEKSPPKPRS